MKSLLNSGSKFPVSRRLAAAFFIILLLTVFCLLHWILASSTLKKLTAGEIQAADITAAMRHHLLFAQANLMAALALALVFLRSVYRAFQRHDEEMKQESEKQRQMAQRSREVQGALISILEDAQHAQNRLRMTANELKAANKKLSEVDKMKSDFLMMASHELKTPLAAVKAYVQILRQGEAGEINEMQKKFLGHVAHAAERLHRLVLDLLNLSKIESGQISFEPAPLELEEILKEEVETFQADAKNRNVELQLQIEGKLAPVFADRSRMEEIVVNLISNALKYTPEGGKVTVIGRMENTEKVEFRVCDTGEGIPPGLEEKIFEPFYRGRKEREPEGDSIGLGLALVKMLVEMHKGTIRVESQHQAGSEFIVTLPVK